MKRFSIPLQTEVSKYIKEKKGWPDNFCVHYGEKFWNHYQASGWKLSSGNLIKDWKACFNAQWQTLKFKEDIELLNQMSGKKAPGTFHQVSNGSKQPTNDFDRLDAFINEMRKPGVTIPFDQFGNWYEFMKANRFLKAMTKADCERLMEIYNNDKIKCRCAVVQLTLSGYISNELTIKDILKIRNQ